MGGGNGERCQNAQGGRGERCQNAQKQFIIKTYPELILYKPVGKYQSIYNGINQGFSYDCVPS